MRKQTFETRIEDRLKAQGLTADQVEKHGNLVSIKVKTNRQKMPTKQFAWRLLEALPGSEVYDFLPEVTGIDQEQYMIVRLSVRESAVVETKKPHTQPMEVCPMMTIDFDQHEGPLVLGPDSSHILAVEEPAEPAKKAKGTRPAKAKVEPAGSFAAQGKQPEIGAVAWVLIERKGGGLKQARCQVLDANAEEAVVLVTKTNATGSVALASLFDHVPHLAGDTWQ